MACSRPKGSVNMTQNRRMPSLPDMMNERMRMYDPTSYGSSEFQGIPLPAHYLPAGTQNSQSIPPPLPPRPDVSRTNRFSSYGSPYYNSYSRFSPSMYSSYGGYRTPYSRFGVGMPPDSYSSFVQLAEESTRPAFESIESVVDIVGSISMMLESTYHAVYSSYNAILGVVDQFSRLKDHLAEVLSFLAILRGLRYLCLKVLYLLRLRKTNPSVEAAWKTATSASENSDFSQFQKDGKSPWPFFMFIGLVIGAPWLMFKLLSRSVGKKPFDLSSWQENNGYIMCIGNYDFSTTRRGELAFKAGEHLYIAPKHLQANVPRGWMLACNKNKQVGLIPRNYLKTQTISAQRKSRPVNTSQLGPVQVIPGKPADVPTPTVSPVNPFAPEEDPSTSEIEPTVPPSVDEQIPENEG